MTKETFGCGTFLPGYGPLSFGEGLPLDVNVPDPDDPPPPGPQLHEGEPPGEIPPPEKNCVCCFKWATSQISSEVTTLPSGKIVKKDTITITLLRECKVDTDCVAADPINYYKNVLIGDGWKNIFISKAKIKEDCNSEEGCDQTKCPPILITAEKEDRSFGPTSPGGPGVPSPGVPGPGAPGSPGGPVTGRPVHPRSPLPPSPNPWEVRVIDPGKLGGIIDEEEVVEGCTDPKAINYNPNAIIDDGSCEYGPQCWLKETYSAGFTGPDHVKQEDLFEEIPGIDQTTYTWKQWCIDPNIFAGFEFHVFPPGCKDGSCDKDPVQAEIDYLLEGANNLLEGEDYHWVLKSKSGGANNDGKAGGNCTGGTLFQEGCSDIIVIVEKKYIPSGGANGTGTGTGGEGLPPPSSPSDEIDLNNFPTKNSLLRNHSTGILDSALIFQTPASIPSTTPGIRVKNKYYSTTSTVLKKIIHKSINSILSKGNSYRSWSLGWSQDLTQVNIFENLNPSFLRTLSKIKYSDGNYISDENIHFLIKSRLLRDASLEEFNSSYFSYLANSQKDSLPSIIPSRNKVINEMYALKILEEASIAVDYKRHTNLRHELLKNYYILPTDIDAKVPIRLSDGTESFLYVKDDNTFGCSTLPIVNPGYFIRLNVSRGTPRLPITTKVNRAYIYGSNYGSAAKKLLGGTGKKSIKTSTSFDGGEFTKTLNLDNSQAYESVYFFSAVLNTVDSTHNSKSFLLKDSSAMYEVMDTSSPQGIEDFNGLIRNIANCEYFYINHDDDIWPSILTSGKVRLTQEDISYFGPTDGTTPLYLRMFSPLIAIMPEGKLECNPFGVRSTIEDMDKDEKIVRNINFIPALDPKFSKNGINPFLDTKTLATRVPTTAPTDVYGNNDIYARITSYTPTKDAFTKNYRVDRIETSVEPSRSMGSFTLIKNIIEELDNNYYLTTDSLGKIIYKTDLFYRLSWKEYSDIVYLNNWNLIYKLVANGLFNDVRLIAPVKNSSEMSINETGLVKRKAAASSDVFNIIKANNNGLFLIPPNTVGEFPAPVPFNPVPLGEFRQSRRLT